MVLSGTRVTVAINLVADGGQRGRKGRTIFSLVGVRCPRIVSSGRGSTVLHLGLSRVPVPARLCYTFAVGLIAMAGPRNVDL